MHWHSTGDGMSRLILAVLLLSVLSGCQEREPPQDPQVAIEPDLSANRSLFRVELAWPDPEPGTCSDRELGVGEIHDLHFELVAEESLHLSLEQRGVDVKVRLVGPSVAPLIFDSPTGVRGTEHIFLVARETGEHRFEILAWDVETSGPYRLCVESRRPAAARDWDRAAAARMFYETRYGEAVEVDQKAARYQRAAELAARAGEQALQARALASLGEVDQKRRRPAAATSSLQQALEIWRQLGDLEQQALVLDQLGSAWRRQGELDLSRDAHQGALDAWRRLGRDAAEATALNNLGLVAQQAGRYRLAFERYSQALMLWERLDERCDMVKTHTNLGSFYALFDEQSRAWDHYRQAVSSAARCEDAKVVSQTLPVVTTKMANLLAEEGQREAALEQYRHALKLRRTAGDRFGEAVTLNSIALVSGSEDPHAAFAAFRSALAIFRELGDASNQATVLRNLAALQESAGDFREARRSNEEALGLASRASNHEAQALAELGLARLAHHAGDLVEAELRARRAVELVEARRGVIARGDLRSSYRASRQAYYDVLVTILADRHRREPGKGFDARAFEVADGSRARNLLDLIGQEPDRAPRVALEALIAEINATHREWLGASLSKASPSLGAIETDLRSLLAKYHELSIRERLDSGTVAFPSLDRIRRETLDPGSLLLVYHFTSSSGWLWAVTPSASILYELAASRSQIETTIATLLASDLRNIEKSEGHLQAISRLLLAPVGRKLGQQRLLITGPGILHTLPWAALPHPVTGRPLGLEHEVVHLPSVAVLEALRARALLRTPAAGSEIAIVANAVYSPDDPRLSRPLPASRPELPWLAPLPGSLTEAKAAARWLGASSREFLGFEARRELLSQGDLAGFRILHFATHALLDLPGSAGIRGGLETEDLFPAIESADLAALVFTRFDRSGRPVDGYLRAYEIRQLELAADLVVLSACRTVLGEDIHGEGLVGLTHAFLAAGARQVVATLWDVDDRATAELMGHFYRELSRGRTPSRALSLAQAAMWRQPKWRAPHFWAGFVFQGDWVPHQGKAPA